MGIDLAPFAQHGLFGLVLGAVLAVVAYVASRGVRVRFEAKIPGKRLAPRKRG